jgi:5'-nucleotidase
MQRLLLTGDDSIQAEGLILMKRLFENKYDIEIVATREQCSAKGNAMNLEGGKWGKALIDKKQVYWVDGYPADAVYFGFDKLGEFDLVISGLNKGLNLTYQTLFRSGTIAAAMTARYGRDTSAIAFSIEADSDGWFEMFEGKLDERLIEYPGKMISEIVEDGMNTEDKFLWNVNFPKYKVEDVIKADMSVEWMYPNKQIYVNDQYKYDFSEIEQYKKASDLDLIKQGKATISSISF